MRILRGNLRGMLHDNVHAIFVLFNLEVPASNKCGSKKNICNALSQKSFDFIPFAVGRCEHYFKRFALALHSVSVVVRRNCFIHNKKKHYRKLVSFRYIKLNEMD